jgi:hypothetical protein
MCCAGLGFLVVNARDGYWSGVDSVNRWGAEVVPKGGGCCPSAVTCDRADDALAEVPSDWKRTLWRSGRAL